MFKGCAGMSTFTRRLIALLMSSAASMQVLGVPLDDSLFAIYRGEQHKQAG